MKKCFAVLAVVAMLTACANNTEGDETSPATSDTATMAPATTDTTSSLPPDTGTTESADTSKTQPKG